LNRKADGGLTAIVIILIVIILLGWLIKVNSRECNSNKDCKEDQYCGSDFSCHQIPVIEKTVVKRSYTLPTLIASITLIILAVIFRWENLFGKKPFVENEKTEEAETPDSYYTSQFKYTAK